MVKAVGGSGGKKAEEKGSSLSRDNVLVIVTYPLGNVNMYR